jgi:hypothetical protein
MRDGPAFASGVEARPQSPIVGVGKGVMMPMAGARWVGWWLGWGAPIEALRSQLGDYAAGGCRCLTQ